VICIVIIKIILSPLEESLSSEDTKQIKDIALLINGYVITFNMSILLRNGYIVLDDRST